MPAKHRVDRRSRQSSADYSMSHAPSSRKNSAASTISQRRASIHTLPSHFTAHSIKRSPLAPLGPQTSTVNAWGQLDRRMSTDGKQGESSKSTLDSFRFDTTYGTSYSEETLANAPTQIPRSRRAPSDLVSDVSSERRTSLPALLRTSRPNGLSGEFGPPPDTTLYDSLKSFTFGAPPPEVSPPPRQPSPDTDEEEMARADRAKMRAIDDGTRRPSLPINIPIERRRPSRPIAEEDDRMQLDSPSPLKALGDLPRSDPGSHRGVLRSQLVANSAAAGFDLTYILAGPSSYPPSMRGTEEDGRISVEDTFTKFVDRNDSDYARRKAEWSFRPDHAASREKSPEAVDLDEEIWYCDWVGRYCIWQNRKDGDRVTRRPLVIRHIDHHSHASEGDFGSVDGSHATPGPAPSVLIHKHSRVHAFSIFRGYHTPGAKIPAASSILLAKKSVQVAYASSKAAARDGHRAGSGHSRHPMSEDASSIPLNTHNLLDDAPAPESTSRMRSRGATVHSSRPPTRDRSPPAMIRQESDGAGPSRDIEMLPLNSQPRMSIDYGVPDEAVTRTTSHAVAFDAIDPAEIDHVYSRAGATFTARLRRAFAGQPIRAHRQSGSPGGPPSAAIEGGYSPPWLLMAPESVRQEEERIIRNLNASFRAVGLIPPRSTEQRRTSDRDSPRTKGTSSARPSPPPSNHKASILDDVPSDAMCMILPLWPSDSGPHSVHASYQTPIAERQYLLVSYVPFENSKPSTKSAESTPTGKKRSRQQRSDGPSSSPSQQKPGSLSSFRVVASMVSYAAVRECGVRVPRQGLSVTGHLSDALLGNPHYHASATSHNVVIAICNGRESGVEFVPEGLDKLGLRSTSNLPIPSSPDLTLPPSQSLSTIGRAVVELVWSGCVAVLGSL